MNILSGFLNRCLGCGTTAEVVCERCWFYLGRPTQNPKFYHIADKPFLQKALFRWDDRDSGRSDMLRTLIMASKRSPRRALVELWVHEFLVASISEEPRFALNEWVLCCPPGRSGRAEADHAGAIAMGLADRLGLQFDDSLVRKNRLSRSQKSKSREERAEIQFHCSKTPWGHGEGPKGYLFIDDVIATGSTARAAWEAYGRPERFEAWAVAWKVRQC